jgi:hypothetical protein
MRMPRLQQSRGLERQSQEQKHGNWRLSGIGNRRFEKLIRWDANQSPAAQKKHVVGLISRRPIESAIA